MINIAYPKMDTPFIAICIPAFKRPDYLKRLLDSICIQSFRNYEILINDNSPDDSIKDLVHSYAEKLSISYEKHPGPMPAVVNCINLVRRAAAPWIKIMHDDDWFSSEDALQHFADAASVSGKDFIFSGCNRVRLEAMAIDKETIIEESKQLLEESVLNLLFKNVIGHPSVVMHKKDNSIEYNPAFNWVLDIDYYIRYINAHQGYYYITEKLVNIGVGPEQETNKYHKNARVEIPEYFDLLAQFDQDLSLKNENVFHLIWIMIARFRIRNVDQVKQLGYKGRMPGKLDEIINYQKNIPRIILKQPSWSEVFMKRCYKKLSKA